MTSPRSSSRGGTKTAVRAYASPSLEVIGQLEVANSLSQLEARLESIESDIARVAANREEDQRHVSGEMGVMRARVEDALNAVTDTAQDLRDAWVSIDEKITNLVDGRVGDQQRTLEALRAQFTSGLEATRMAIEAAEARLHGEVEALSGTNIEQVRGISDLVEQARVRIDEAVAGVEGRVSEVVAGASTTTNGSFDAEIAQLSAQLRDELITREKLFEERIAEVADSVSGVATSFDMLMSKLAGTEARAMGSKAGTDASVAVLTQQVRSLEARIGDLAETVATSTTEKMNAMSGQVTEVREAILRVAERVGSTAFLTRRVADLEVRLAEMNAKLDRPDSI
jgi:predicted  nucleic acid-binding Zn-ribbon protein